MTALFQKLKDGTAVKLLLKELDEHYSVGCWRVPRAELMDIFYIPLSLSGTVNLKYRILGRCIKELKRMPKYSNLRVDGPDCDFDLGYLEQEFVFKWDTGGSTAETLMNSIIDDTFEG